MRSNRVVSIFSIPSFRANGSLSETQCRAGRNDGLECAQTLYYSNASTYYNTAQPLYTYLQVLYS